MAPSLTTLDCTKGGLLLKPGLSETIGIFGERTGDTEPHELRCIGNTSSEQDECHKDENENPLGF